jgi:hypothetical protein
MSGKRVMEGPRGIDRLPKMLAPGAQMTDMVKVVMGHENGLERVEAETPLCQIFLEPTKTDPGVYHEAGCPVMEEITIAATPARETHETQHHFSPSSQYFEITL